MIVWPVAFSSPPALPLVAVLAAMVTLLNVAALLLASPPPLLAVLPAKRVLVI